MNRRGFFAFLAGLFVVKPQPAPVVRGWDWGTREYAAWTGFDRDRLYVLNQSERWARAEGFHQGMIWEAPK